MSDRKSVVGISSDANINTTDDASEQKLQKYYNWNEVKLPDESPLEFATRMHGGDLGFAIDVLSSRVDIDDYFGETPEEYPSIVSRIWNDQALQ